jgi:adenylate cyclase
MSAKEQNLAVMFADVSQSTKLYEQLGDTDARALIAAVLLRMTNITRKLGGTVIKTIGDEVMSSFPSAESGVIAACTIQEGIAKNPPKGVPVGIRIGVHHGPVLLENNDLFGTTVNIAARMAAIAKAGQIITTAETAGVLTGVLADKAQLFDRTQVKGISGELDTYRIDWESHEEVTIIAPTTGFSPQSFAVGPLVLRCGGEERRMDPEADAFILGRADTCDLAVPASLASRQHARIEFRRGRFILVDQSSNGTWVRSGSGKDTYLRREEHPLHGRGWISLGPPIDPADPACVSYSAPN